MVPDCEEAARDEEAEALDRRSIVRPREPDGCEAPTAKDTEGFTTSPSVSLLTMDFTLEDCEACP